MFERIRPLRAALMAGAVGLLAAPLASAFGIGLQPTTVEMEVEPGGRNRQLVTIGNVHTEKTISLTLGLADWTLDEQGKIDLAPPGEASDSAAEWVRFSPAFVTLKPGQSQQIVVDMATPSRLSRSGDFRFALIASTVLPDERGGQSGVWKKYQIASLFYLTAGDAQSLPAITSSGFTKLEDGSSALDLTIENAGNAHARLGGSVDVYKSDAQPVSIPIENLVVLNGAKRLYQLPLPEELTAGDRVEVKLENTFAPQAEGATELLAPYRIGGRGAPQ